MQEFKGSHPQDGYETIHRQYLSHATACKVQACRWSSRGPTKKRQNPIACQPVWMKLIQSVHFFKRKRSIMVSSGFPKAFPTKNKAIEEIY